MTSMKVTRQIKAPLPLVFDTVAEISNFSKAVPHIIKVEFLGEQKVGVGTRFKETRVMNGKEATTELEVTEYEPNERVRIISDTHGTVWDTLFTVAEAEGKTELTMVMDAKAYKLLPKIINPLIKGMVLKAVESDMDAIKAYCEGQANAPGQS